MNALETLRQMHVEAKSAFQEIEQASPDQRGMLWHRLQPELELHEHVEEEFVYKPVAHDVENTDEELASWDARHHTQVQEAETLIQQISQMDPAEASWMAQVSMLQGMLEQHIQTEEGEIWPRIQQQWSADRLEEADRQIQAAKSSGVGEAKAA